MFSNFAVFIYAQSKNFGVRIFTLLYYSQSVPTSFHGRRVVKELFCKYRLLSRDAEDSLAREYLNLVEEADQADAKVEI